MNKVHKLHQLPWPALYAARRYLASETGLTQYRILFLQMSIYVIVCIKCARCASAVFPAIAKCLGFVYWRNFENVFFPREFLYTYPGSQKRNMSKVCLPKGPLCTIRCTFLFVRKKYE